MSNDLNSGTVGGFGHMGPNDPYGGSGSSGGTPNGHGGSGATGTANAGTSDSALLLQASSVLTDLGDRYTGKMSAGLKSICDELKTEISTFKSFAYPAKVLRTTDDAWASFEAILANPSMRLSDAELNTVVGSLKLNEAYAIANSLGN